MLLRLSKKQLKQLADKEYNYQQDNLEIFKNSIAIAKNFSKLYGVTLAYLIKLQNGTLVYYPNGYLPTGTREKYDFIK